MNFRDVAIRELSELQAEIEVRKCPDQYLGRLADIEDAGSLSKRKPAAARPSRGRCLLLVLESPHISEFAGEPGPAKGTTGKNIAKYLRKIPGLESFADHGLILMNAIQHQCSLGFPTERFRDRVFRDVWNTGGREDFIARIQALHKLGDTIVNCCTKGTSSTTGTELRLLVQGAITTALPGVQVVRRNHPSFWHFSANREREW